MVDDNEATNTAPSRAQEQQQQPAISSLQRFLISALIAWLATLYFRDGSTAAPTKAPAAQTPPSAVANNVPHIPAAVTRPTVKAAEVVEYDEHGFAKKTATVTAEEPAAESSSEVVFEHSECMHEAAIGGAAPRVSIRYCSS
jgi:hypothetical protein